MCENSSLNKLVSINLAVSSAADDIFQTNSQRADELPCKSDEKSQRQSEPVILKKCPARKNQQEIGSGKKAITIVKEEVSDADNHLTAMIPQKLYHLKKTSQ